MYNDPLAFGHYILHDRARVLSSRTKIIQQEGKKKLSLQHFHSFCSLEHIDIRRLQPEFRILRVSDIPFDQYFVFRLLQRFHSAMHARACMPFLQYKIVRSNRKRRRWRLFQRTCSLFNDVRFDQYLGVSRNDPTWPSYARAYISIYERIPFSGKRKKKLI